MSFVCSLLFFNAPIYSFSASMQSIDSVRFHCDLISPSGFDIFRFLNREVIFAGSESLLSSSELERINSNAITFPMLAIAVVLSYNLPNFPTNLALVISRDVLVDIFLGQITTWNHTRLQNLNPLVCSLIRDNPVEPVE